MAAKKKASKSKAVALPWKQQLAQHAKAGKAPKEKALTGDYISTKGSKFTLNGVKIGLDGKGRELDCVVLGYIFEKSYYDTDYVEGQASSPACFALGYDEDELTPNETSPNKQCESCVDCELNEWGSGRGEGKACSDRRRLALAVEGADGKIELKLLNIAPTSLKNWKSFINDVDTQGLHPMQCAVNIHFDEDSTATSPPLVFDFVNEITNEKTLQAMAATLEQANKMLEQPYDVSNYKKTTKKKAKKKASKKKAAKRKSKFS